ncbi:MAG: DNA polymerase III subunit alpha, partial [Dehalococcoidia bacterium]|nr:DNA polymerase III subunit alpha [Dehalococcoidia bacterium]
HPFSALVRKGALFNTTLCGQIDAGMAGQTVVAAGMVDSVRYLLTRDGKPFASAVLEDLDGRIEVMVWPRVYADTKDLWQEGNMLLVEGRVRQKDEQVQLNCNSVRYYQPETAPVEPPATPEAEEAPPAGEAVPAARRRLIISIAQTDDEAGDLTRLKELVDTLRGFPGKDEAWLSVTNEKKVSTLKLSNLAVSYCPELLERLAGLVGEDSIKLVE